MRGEPKEGARARMEISCADAAKNRGVRGCCGIIGERAGGGSSCLPAPEGRAGKKSESIYSNSPVPALAARPAPQRENCGTPRPEPFPPAVAIFRLLISDVSERGGRASSRIANLLPAAPSRCTRRAYAGEGRKAGGTEVGEASASRSA